MYGKLQRLIVHINPVLYITSVQHALAQPAVTNFVMSRLMNKSWFHINSTRASVLPINHVQALILYYIQNIIGLLRTWINALDILVKMQ
jgi:hypothetical protein